MLRSRRLATCAFLSLGLAAAAILVVHPLHSEAKEELIRPSSRSSRLIERGTGVARGSRHACTTAEQRHPTHTDDVAVVTTVCPSRARDGDTLSVSVTNIGNLPLWYGSTHFIEREVGDMWVDTRSHWRYPWPTWARKLEPGAQVDYDVKIELLPPGRYRVLKSFADRLPAYDPDYKNVISSGLFDVVL